MFKKAQYKTTKLIKGIKHRIVTTVIYFDTCVGIGTDQITPYYHVNKFMNKVITPIEQKDAAAPTSSEFNKANTKNLQKKNSGKRSKNQN